jgi:hypothetical protein
MLNVQALSAKLASMPDQALQQFAAMNKSDPYSLALAVSESNRRQAMRSAAQAQPMPEGAPVADQVIAGMAPENVGIATIAPDNVADMADGGIVAFADRGEVPRTSGQRMAQEWSEKVRNWRPEMMGFRTLLNAAEEVPGAIAGIKGGPEITYRNPDDTPNPSAPAEEWLAYRERQKRRAEEMAAYKNALGAPRSGNTAAGLAELESQPITASMRPPVDYAAAPDQSAAETARLARQDTLASYGLSPYTGPSGRGAAGGPAPLGGGAKAPAGSGVALLPAAQQYMSQLRKLSGIDAAGEELRKGEQGIAAAEQEAIQAYRKEFDEAVARRGILGEEREKRLKEQQTELGDRKSRAGYEALLEASLAAMSGTSPSALVNLGKAGQVGTKAYGEKVEKIADAQEKLNQALGQIEDARRSENIQTEESRLAMGRQERQAKINGMRAINTLNKELKLNMPTQMAGKAFEAAIQMQKLQVEEAGRNARAQLVHSGGAGGARSEIALGRLNVQQLNSRRIGVTALLKDAVNDGNDAAAAEYRRQLNEINAQLAAKSSPGGAATATASGKVIDFSSIGKNTGQ